MEANRRSPPMDLEAYFMTLFDPKAEVRSPKAKGRNPRMDDSGEFSVSIPDPKAKRRNHRRDSGEFPDPKAKERSPKAKRRNPRRDSGEFPVLLLTDNHEIGEEASDWMDYSEDGAIDLSYRRPYKPITIRNRKFPRRLRPSPFEGWNGRVNRSMPSTVTPAIRRSLRVSATGLPNNTADNRYKATVDQAIDPRTRMVLFKMMKRGVFDQINGCISTGKEVDVYHATKHDGQEFAVKVYKTPVLEFKDRHGYCNPNPEKVAQARAENEMMKLTRLKAAGIRCPTPLHLKLHVLVLEFIGESGRAAPRLENANLSEDKMRECYVQMIMMMRMLYHKCKLVHGDLSENKILYYEGNLHIIDVPQSVDVDHPEALYYLFLDCIHVSSFFGKKGVGVESTRLLFDFIIDSSMSDESVDHYIEEVRQKILAWGVIMSELISESGIPRSARGQLRICSQYCSMAQNQLPEQTNVSDTNDHFTDQTNISGAEPETDEDDASDPFADQPKISDTNDHFTDQTNSCVTEPETVEDDTSDPFTDQPKISDTHDSSTDQTNSCVTEIEDENDEVDDDSSCDSKGVEPSDTTKRETLRADKKAARKENKKKVKEEKRGS